MAKTVQIEGRLPRDPFEKMMHPSHNMMVYDRDRQFVVFDNELIWNKAVYENIGDALSGNLKWPKSVQISPNRFMFVGSIEISKKCFVVDTKEQKALRL